MPGWLKDAVFYEIYPQSFCDSNGDGIGDFNGIISKLDYVRSIGCNALWINPCFDSPFQDAGYDVRDYKKAAPRYGTNEDLFSLFRQAHKKGIHVLLDLVPGHTSQEHEWFRKSCELERNEYSDRYIWTDFCFRGTGNYGYPYIGGETSRPGTYLLNFFKCQPALNYGWLHADEAWKYSCDSEEAAATREAMKDVMRFWMDHGCDGFRVDMAASLVKGDDEKKTGTSRIWKNIRQMLDKEYPSCALVAEWSNPDLSLKAGFHMDFLLNEFGSLQSTLIRDYQFHGGRICLSDPWFTGKDKDTLGKSVTLDKIREAISGGRNAEGVPYFVCGQGEGAEQGTKAAGNCEKVSDYYDHSFFRKDSGGDITRFMKAYIDLIQRTGDLGYVSMLSCNHDTVRPAFSLDEREMKLYYSFLLTMPGVPFLYYGDEIGLRYLNLKTKEGGYFRTGSRTPMQWDSSKNLGFSDAAPEDLYLPVDPSEDAPTVENQERDSNSLLNTVRSLLTLRHTDPDLQSSQNLEILYMKEGKLPFVCRRGHRILAVNPSSQTASADIKASSSPLGALAPIWSIGGGSLNNGTITLEPQSFVVF